MKKISIKDIDLKKFNIKKSWIVISIAIVSILLIVMFSYKGRMFGKSNFEKNIDIIVGYGFNFANEGKISGNKEITKGELAKVIISLLYNLRDHSELGGGYIFEDPNSYWVDIGYRREIFTKEQINNDNINSKVTFRDMITYLTRTLKDRNIIEFGKVQGYTEKTLNEDENKTMKYLVDNNIVPKKDIELNKNVSREKAYIIVLKLLQKNGIIDVLGREIRTTDLPTNSSEYPYILKDVSNEIYQAKNIGIDTADKAAKTLNIKEVYYGNELSYNKRIKYKEYIENFYNTILNIDYKTITSEDLYNKLKDITRLDKKAIDGYVDKIKRDKINIKGKISVEPSIVYYQSPYYYYRSRIEFEILEADNLDNVLLMDFYEYFDYKGMRLTYQKNYKYNLLIDAPISMTTKDTEEEARAGIKSIYYTTDNIKNSGFNFTTITLDN